MSKAGRAPWTHMSHFLDISHCALNSLPLCSFMAFLWGHFSATIRSVSNSCSSRRRRGRSPRSPPDIIDPQRTLLHFAGAPSLPGVMCWIITTMQCIAVHRGEKALQCTWVQQQRSLVHRPGPDKRRARQSPNHDAAAPSCNQDALHCNSTVDDAATFAVNQIALCTRL